MARDRTGESKGVEAKKAKAASCGKPACLICWRLAICPNTSLYRVRSVSLESMPATRARSAAALRPIRYGSRSPARPPAMDFCAFVSSK